jgi:hypothetical protein
MEFGNFQSDLILQGYEGAAADLIARYEAIQPANRAAGVTWTWLAFSRAI